MLNVVDSAAMLLLRGDGFVERVEERTIMKVLELIAIQLRQLGADGLCNGEGDLAPCEDWMGDCVPAMAVEERILDVGEDCEIIYIPLESDNE
jgi:hypothetical protein